MAACALWYGLFSAWSCHENPPVPPLSKGGEGGIWVSVDGHAGGSLSLGNSPGASFVVVFRVGL